MKIDPETPRCGCADVCTLPPEALETRLETVRREILPHVRRTERLPGGRAAELERTPALETKLSELVELERECCGTLRWTLEVGERTLRLRVEGIDPDAAFFAEVAGGSRS